MATELVKVKFRKKGLKACVNEGPQPTFYVEKDGDIHEVDEATARVFVEAGSGEYVTDESEDAEGAEPEPEDAEEFDEYDDLE